MIEFLFGPAWKYVNNFRFISSFYLEMFVATYANTLTALTYKNSVFAQGVDDQMNLHQSPLRVARRSALQNATCFVAGSIESRIGRIKRRTSSGFRQAFWTPEFRFAPLGSPFDQLASRSDAPGEFNE
jgi:hypothetical protein